MSKVLELREKYKNISDYMFDKLNSGDKTKTKKYLEYMLKIWCNKKDCEYSSNSFMKLVNAINDFDSLLPYIQNKDIYHPDYHKFSNLRLVIDKAIIEREEKTFIKEDHVNVLYETEDYLLIQPLTHRGSLKYGANTKWCTASKNHPDTFNHHIRNGCLIYLIDKTGKRGVNYNKVAFLTYAGTLYFESVGIWNTTDVPVCTESLMKGNWSSEELFTISTVVRLYSIKWNVRVQSKHEINIFIKNLESFDFDDLKKSIVSLESKSDISYISEAKDAIKQFLEKINTFNYGGFTKTES